MTSLVFLDPHPLLLVTYSDGTIRVWGVKGSPLKGLLVLTFSNQAPKEACFWGGEDAEYPLLRYDDIASGFDCLCERLAREITFRRVSHIYLCRLTCYRQALYCVKDRYDVMPTKA